MRVSSQARIKIENGNPDMPNYQKSIGLPPKTRSTPGHKIRNIAKTVSKAMPWSMTEFTGDVVNDDLRLLQEKILLH